MKLYFLAIITLAALGFELSSAVAQQAGPDAFFRPVTSGDLNTRLPPRLDQNRILTGGGSDSDFFSFSGNGGCPETVLIGSVDGDTEVFGGVDIDVVIENDIVINCGGL